MTTAKVQTQTSYHCASLPVDGYAFHFLQVLKNIHASNGNFAPVPLQKIVDLLPEEFRDYNTYEEIDVLYDQEIIDSYYGSGFFVVERYR